MNIHTPIFRGGLTLAAIWIAVWGYILATGYQSEIVRLELERYTIPERLTDDCYALKFDFEAERLREPTLAEKQLCLDIARVSHTRLLASSKAFATEQAWKGFALKGALPATAMLGMIAFWHSIVIAFSRVGGAYVKWLRFGASGSPEKKDDS